MHKAGFLLLLLLSFWGSKKALCAHRLGLRNIHNGKIINIDPDPYGDFTTITVPIKRTGSLIIIEAQLDTMIGNFILDTGAPGLILNETYFRNFPHIGDKESGGINGQTEHAFSTVVRNFSILDLHYDRITADVTDLSRIENRKGIKILGLLGTRLFAKLAITIDLFNNVLYIHKLDEKGEIAQNERVFNKPDMKTSFKLLNDVIFIKGSIEDNNLWFTFDTGAECNLLDYDNFKKIAKRMRVLNQSALTGVDGHVNPTNYAVFDKLVIGNYLFTHNRILLARLDHMGYAYGNTMDAILGYDFFARGIFTINFVKKELEMYIYTYEDK
ncbi:MAG: hypothetical protein JWR67_2725 [Mucilaginibacter sp.]|nr:hypothetical protein [Mucilaginibacter sp.]